MKNLILRYFTVTVKNSLIFFCASSLVFSFTTLTAQVKLVKDLNQISNVSSFDFSDLTEFKGKAFFVFTDWNGSAIPELWVSDGTFKGTVLLKRFDAISNLKVSGSYLYFIASELTPECYYDQEPCAFQPHGRELWKTDGTVDGTVIVKDIYPGETSSDPAQLTDLDGTLYFTANDGTRGNELWRSNGTAESTVLVKDIQRGSSNPEYLVTLSHALYFSANDGIKGFELWRSDGTATGTFIVVDIAPASKISSWPQQMVNANGMLYFFANDHINGRQLWKSDGSLGNASLVKVIRPGSNHLDYLTSVNDLVFFQANDGIHGNELWRSDGTEANTFLVKDITPGSGSQTQYATPHIYDFKNCNGKLYFFGVNDNGKRIWVSDGTPEGTKILTDRNFYLWGSHGATAFNGKTFFGIDNGYDVDNYYFSTSEIWETNGTPEGTSLLIANEGSGDQSNFIPAVVGNNLFFFMGDALWKTDGTKAGTERIRGLSNQEGSSIPSDLTDVNGTLYFEANDGQHFQGLWQTSSTNRDDVHILQGWMQSIGEFRNVNGKLFFAGNDYRGQEPWQSNGTLDGTSIIKDIAVDPSSARVNSDPSQFTSLNGEIFFRAAAFQKPFDLWKTDGTEAGTTTIRDPDSESFYNPTNLTTVANKLFFAAENENVGQELWISNGTTAGTMLLKDIKRNAGSSGAIRFTPFNNLLYFQADDGSSGYELWRSNGTTAGTYRVKDICLNDKGDASHLAPLDMGNMIATSKAVFLSAILPNGHNALWKSNGSAGSTVIMKEFDGAPVINIFSTLGNSILFTVKYPTYLELWMSDGTPATTRKVKELPYLQNIVQPYEVAKVNNTVYFLGYDGTKNRIWRSNGSEAGTYEIIFDGNTHEIETAGGVVYASAETARWGWELFWVDDEQLTMPLARQAIIDEFGDAIKEKEKIVFSYPNPFQSQLTLEVKNNDENTFELSVFTLDGRATEHYQTLPCNTPNAIGQSWANGIYILRINTGQKYMTEKVFKMN